MARAVIDNKIEHEIEVVGQGGHVGPGSEGGIDLAVVDDGEAVVGGVGEEGQDVDSTENVSQAAVEEELALGFQRGLVRLADLIAVGNENGIGLVPRGALGGDLGKCVVDVLQELCQDFFDIAGIEASQVGADSFAACGADGHSSFGDWWKMRWGRLEAILPQAGILTITPEEYSRWELP